MSAIPVRYFDGRQARAIDAWLLPVAGGVLLRTAEGEQAYCLADVRVQPRMGDMLPSIDLPDGGQIMLPAGDLPPWLMQGSARFWQRLHGWESRLHYVVLALLLVGLAAVGMVRYGIPLLAKSVAMALPPATEQVLARNTLDFFDRYMVKPSRLLPARQEALRQQFRAMTGKNARLQLEFRDGERLGANAFALPNGTIVMTDQLVELADNDSELMSVLAHEAGHVKYRHSLRLVLSGSATAVLIAALTGDVSSASAALSAGLPTALSHAHYSQAFEHEADDYARALIQSRGIPLHHFADILSRLQAERGTEEENGMNRYLSSHPPTADRIRPFREQAAP